MQPSLESTSTAIVTRPASDSDVDWLIPQLKKFSTFYGTKRPLFGDEEYARNIVLNMINDHLFLIADRKDVGPVGFIAGIVTPHLLNPGIRLLAESFWWVDEEYRGTRAGIYLFEAFVEWGRANCDWITFALEHHSPVKDQTLLSRGFKLQEKSFLMEVN